MASRYRRLRARALKVFFGAHAAVYEASGGRIGTRLGSLPVLLLTVTGRSSGIQRSTPLVYFEDHGTYVVVGSDGGARRDPQWWNNLQANPTATLRVGRRALVAKASLATGAERARLWRIGQDVNPMWAHYQRQTTREIPVVILRPTDTWPEGA